jgi:hypothetical protein
MSEKDFWEGYVPEPVKSGEGASATVTITLPAPRVVDCHATGVCVQSGLQAEQPAPVQQEPTVSKGAYNRVRDDYNDLLKQSEQDAKDAKEWRAHVNRCKLAGIDLDYQITAPQPAQQEYASFAEWAHDYVQDNLHKLKPAQRTWVGLTDERIESVRHMRDVQGYDGNWNYDPYMQGLYNGLEFALSLLEVREPQFKDAPETWLGDIKVKYKLSSETEAKLRSKNEDRN